MRWSVTPVLLIAIASCAGGEPIELPDVTVAEWEAHAERIRAGIRKKVGIERNEGPIGPVITHGLRVHDGYTVENVAFATFPGFYLTGNLYRPLGRVGPRPAVLNPHGHFHDPYWTPRTRPDMQIRCAQLARMGAVAFTWDMVGYGESYLPHHHNPLVASLQTWNSLRALDFIVSLPEVDPERVMITGASGGASQALALMALDPRPFLAAHVVMVSAHDDGECNCENFYPEDDTLHGNLEVAAMAAPRPLLIVSDGMDQTADTPWLELPFLRSVYALYGAEERVENVHLESEGHDYGASKRAALYEFVSRHAGLELLPEDVELEPLSALQVWNDQHPLPPDALRDVVAPAPSSPRR
jgi:hypothetical protein